MKIAVMQPYIFPYIGYFQMINAVDKFVFYDNVNFIKQGWINRNKILVSGKDFLFTVPLEKATSFALINETKINQKFYPNWKAKFLQTLTQSYKKAPYFEDVYKLVSDTLDSQHIFISDLAIESIRMIAKYLKMSTEFIVSSDTYNNVDMERQERLFDICRKEGADHYINAVGGQDLYDKNDFQKEGIKLDFIKSLPISYKQLNHEFVPWLSIIDVLMFNEISEVQEILTKYQL
jgi:hypothetical protein